MPCCCATCRLAILSGSPKLKIAGGNHGIGLNQQYGELTEPVFEEIRAHHDVCRRERVAYRYRAPGQSRAGAKSLAIDSKMALRYE
jgi:hypothetical protein